VRRGLPADAARGRARLVEVGQTLLHHGATIRAAGDELGMPTSTLRHWLREAGVRVGADGTLSGSAGPAPSRPGKGKKEHGGGACGTVAGPGRRPLLAERRRRQRPSPEHRSRCSMS